MNGNHLAVEDSTEASVVSLRAEDFQDSLFNIKVSIIECFVETR